MPLSRISAALPALVAGVWIAGGQDSSSGANDPTDRVTGSKGPGAQVAGKKGRLKPIRWGPVRTAKRGVMIGALVGHCKNGAPRPYIERIARHRLGKRVTITMFVRFPPRRTGPDASGCLYLDIGVSKWIKLRGNPSRLRFFDGATSPPTRRQLAFNH